MKNIKRMIVILIVGLFCLGGTFVYAGNGGGKGNGDGSGDGGGESPLSLESSIPSNDAKDVAIDATIELTFSNNVVNMSVADNNKECFQLLNSKNEEVAIEVIIGDDQVDPTIKNNISIKPVSVFDENESYTLIIKKKLQSKNGSVLGEEVKLPFHTVGDTTNNTVTLVIIVIVVIVVVLGIVGVLIKRNKKEV